MVFNHSVNGGPTFGPKHWAGDVIMCGESRGKLWRTKLVKTDVGYVGATQLFACLQMLTVDACVAPDGDLVVACHSGPPDWGTGPTGKGKLYRIKYTAPDQAQPIATWAESPNEIRVAFNQPLDPLKLRNLTGQSTIQYGDYVRAGDRYETLVPPYAVVQRQLMSSRFDLPVASASLTTDLRNIILSTAALKVDSHFAITLPREQSTESNAKPSPHALTELDLTQDGVQVTWNPSNKAITQHASSQSATLATWIPHLDLSVAKQLTAGSQQHDALWQALASAGELTLKTKVNLHSLLRPAVQPGSKLDYQWPPETVFFEVRSSQPIELMTSSGKIESTSSDTAHTAIVTCSGDASELVEAHDQAHQQDRDLSQVDSGGSHQ